MTQLQSISGNHISFECQCGHSPKVAVMDLIERHGREMQVNDLIRKSKCSVCGQKGKFHWRIIYIGGSGVAMLGTETRPKTPPADTK